MVTELNKMLKNNITAKNVTIPMLSLVINAGRFLQIANLVLVYLQLFLIDSV